MSYLLLNAPAILLATLAGLLVTLVGWPGARSPRLVPAALAQAWLAAILAGALIVAPVQAGLWTVTLMTPVVIWSGFVLPTVLGGYRLRGLGWGAVTRDVALWLVIMLAQAVVLRLVGVSAPLSPPA